MVDFIKDKNTFRNLEQCVYLRFKQKSFEQNPFKSHFRYFLAFEFEFIYHELFFEGLKVFLEQIGDENVCFYTLSPSPAKYFFQNFKKYSVFEIDVTASYDELNSILTKDPGNSPADSLVDNSNEICWFSKSDKWSILASREWEIAIVGFSDLEVKEKFKESFNEDAQTMYTSVQEQVNVLNEMLCFKEEVRTEYQKLIESYRENANE